VSTRGRVFNVRGTRFLVTGRGPYLVEQWCNCVLGPHWHRVNDAPVGTMIEVRRLVRSIV
jgi:hypothetical protein